MEPELKEHCREDYVDEYDPDAEPEYYPRPTYAEYRVVRVTKIHEVIEYGNSKIMGPVFQKDPDLDVARKKDATQKEDFEKMLAELSENGAE